MTAVGISIGGEERGGVCWWEFRSLQVPGCVGLAQLGLALRPRLSSHLHRACLVHDSISVFSFLF
jgi:hypothetical protein